MKLVSTRTIHAPLERCFDLTRSVDVHVYTSRTIAGRAIGGKRHGLAALGDQTTWSARFFGIRCALTTEIQRCEAPHHLTDWLRHGAFLEFGHHYRLLELRTGQVELEDAFTFRSPGGWLGRVFDEWVLRPVMRRVMESRLDDIKRLAESDGWNVFLQRNDHERMMPR